MLPATLSVILNIDGVEINATGPQAIWAGVAIAAIWALVRIAKR